MMINRELDSNEYMVYMGKAEFEKALHTLMGLIQGISIDKKLNALELAELQHWLQLHSNYRNKYPFKEIIPLVAGSIEDHLLEVDEVEDILWVCNQYLNENPYFDTYTRDIQILQGLIHGIMSDNHITEEELVGLKKWLIDHDHLETVYPYDEIFSILSSVLQDNRIDDEEQNVLKAIFSDFIDMKLSYNLNQSEFEELTKSMNIQGICALGPNIEIEGKLFCFTGSSSKTKRSEISKLIEEKQGSYKDSVVKDTDYLIVGDEGNPCWAFSCYGRKIEKAINLRKQGKRIIIAHEVDFWDSI